MTGNRLFCRTACLITALAASLLLIVPAAAISPSIDLSKTASLSITELDSGTLQPVAGLELTIYRAASFTDNTGAAFTVTDQFSSCGVNINQLDTAAKQTAAAASMADYIDSHAITGLTKKTAANGNVAFTGLSLGLYLVRVTSTAGTNATAESDAFFVSLPMPQDSAWNYDVSATPKCTVSTGGKTTSHRVTKEWADSDNAGDTRPSDISVGLYRDGALQDTVTLNAANGWTYTWSNLSDQYTWTNKETAVPAGYTESVEENGRLTVITNTYSGTSSGTVSSPAGVSIPDNATPLGTFPQTGQNVIRIWLLLGAGLIFAAFGVCELALDRRKEKHD